MASTKKVRAHVEPGGRFSWLEIDGERQKNVVGFSMQCHLGTLSTCTVEYSFVGADVDFEEVHVDRIQNATHLESEYKEYRRAPIAGD